MEIKCLRGICGKKLIINRCEAKLSVLEKALNELLRWLGHLMRMIYKRIVKNVYKL